MHIRWPAGIKPGRTIDQVALSMDLAPTLLRAAGVRISRPADGIDLMPFISGARSAQERTVFWRYKRAQNVRKAVRHGNWKYADDSGSQTLFDLGADPAEKHDLLTERPEVVADLRQRLGAWERDVQAPRLRGFTKESNNGRN
jgi:arylsulfatase A-like enzyme